MNATTKKPRTKKVINSNVKTLKNQPIQLLSETELKKKVSNKSVTELSKKDFNIIHLKPNVTGKMLMSKKFEANKVAKNEILAEIYSFSASLKRAIKHLTNQGFFDSFKKSIDLNELTPKNLLPLQTEKQQNRKTPDVFSIFLTMTLIEKYCKNVARQGYKIKSAK